MGLNDILQDNAIKQLNRTDEDLVKKIKTRAPTSGQWTTKRLNNLLSDIRKINSNIYAKTTDLLNKEFIDIVNYEAGFQSEMLTDALPIKWDVSAPSSALLQSTMLKTPFQGRLMAEWFEDLTLANYARIRDAVRIGVIEGEPVDAIARRVYGTRALRNKDGVLEVGRRALKTFVRTAVNHTVSTARSLIAESNSDIIKGEKWLSTLDGRTTPICMGRDGKVYAINVGPRPPAHRGCRSTTSFVVKSWKELGIKLKDAPQGTRASMNGQVPSKLTYNDWLKRSGTKEQDKILGVTRGKLFRQGKLPVDRFVDARGNTLTLDELRVTEKEAFTKANL